MAKRAGWIIACVVVGTVFYLLPWTGHSTAGFTMNGFDLAEWTSLHPAVRSSSPAMLTSFLLRAPLVALAAVGAVAAQALPGARVRWLAWGAAAALVVRLIPPAEFFTGTTGDPNYRQMLLLSAIGFGLVAGAIALRALPDGIRRGVVAALWVAGAAAGVAGLSRAWTLLDNFEIDVTTGPGVVGFVGVSALAAALALWPRALPGEENKKGG
jgi:hypothetical protein